MEKKECKVTRQFDKDVQKIIKEKTKEGESVTATGSIIYSAYLQVDENVLRFHDVINVEEKDSFIYIYRKHGQKSIINKQHLKYINIDCNMFNL